MNSLPRFSPLLISIERSPLRGDRSREIDLFDNLDIVHIRLLVDARGPMRVGGALMQDPAAVRRKIVLVCVLNFKEQMNPCAPAT